MIPSKTQSGIDKMLSSMSLDDDWMLAFLEECVFVFFTVIVLFFVIL